ncbi:MAG TPA: hypothetical protein VFK02_14000 [Kofleriaceae bacterium]|nr:hypothetical protein [Kofleriaceae bacterium]
MRAHAVLLDLTHRMVLSDGATLVAEVHYFAAESARIGVPFSDDAELYYEYFRLLHVFHRA